MSLHDALKEAVKIYNSCLLNLAEIPRPTKWKRTVGLLPQNGYCQNNFRCIKRNDGQ